MKDGRSRALVNRAESAVAFSRSIRGFGASNLQTERDQSIVVSIILPNQNDSRYLPDSLNAIRAQSWPALDIIVVDDASTDDSCAVVKEFAKEDRRIRLLPLTAKVGINEAVAIGLKESRGSYLYFAAADDWIAPRFIECSVGLLRQFPESALCFSDPTELREDGSRHSFPLYLSDLPRSFSPDEIKQLLRLSYFHLSTNTVVFRRNLFEQFGGFPTELHWLSDWFTINSLALLHGVCYLPEPLTRLAVRSNSYSAVNLRRKAEQRELFLRTLERLGQPGFEQLRSAFREAALLPEYRMRDIVWLMKSRHHRDFLSFFLIRRILTQALWARLRPAMSSNLRRLCRRVMMMRSQSILPPEERDESDPLTEHEAARSSSTRSWSVQEPVTLQRRNLS